MRAFFALFIAESDAAIMSDIDIPEGAEMLCTMTTGAEMIESSPCARALNGAMASRSVRSRAGYTGGPATPDGMSAISPRFVIVHVTFAPSLHVSVPHPGLKLFGLSNRVRRRSPVVIPLLDATLASKSLFEAGGKTGNNRFTPWNCESPPYPPRNPIANLSLVRPVIRVGTVRLGIEGSEIDGGTPSDRLANTASKITLFVPNIVFSAVNGGCFSRRSEENATRRQEEKKAGRGE